MIRMQNRPFANADEMNRMLIENYNSVVHKNDTVYLLGDICFRIGIEKANELIASLKGKKYLIRGNHDKKYDEKLFEEVRDFMTISADVFIFRLCIIQCFHGQEVIMMNMLNII